MSKVNVLMVCLGNICRSPTAQGVFENFVAEQGLSHHINTDSAGTHAYHVGEPPDSRAQASALRRGVDLSPQRARKVEQQDFINFDYVLAMDHSNHADLMAMCPGEHVSKVHLFLSFAPAVPEDEVPDPYYGGGKGFEKVLDLVEEASMGLLEDIRKHHL